MIGHLAPAAGLGLESKVSLSSVTNVNARTASVGRTNCVKVSNIPYGVLDAELFRPFSEIGGIVYNECRLDRKQGSAIVVYESAEEAQRAVKMLHGALIRKNYLNVETLSRPSKILGSGLYAGVANGLAKDTSFDGIYIGNLPATATEKDVFMLFKDFKDSIQRINREMGRSFATIKFTTAATAKDAVDKVNNAKLEGRKLRLDYDLPTAQIPTIVRISLMALSTTKDEVEAHFRHLGAVSVAGDAETGYKTKSALVEFPSRYTADIAVGDIRLESRVY